MQTLTADEITTGDLVRLDNITRRDGTTVYAVAVAVEQIGNRVRIVAIDERDGHTVEVKYPAAYPIAVVPTAPAVPTVDVSRVNVR